MNKPVIGITAFSLEGSCLRSAVNQAYVDAIVSAGGTPFCIPLGIEEDSLDQLYSLIDGLLLPGGDDVAPEQYGEERLPALGEVDEARDELELPLARRALADDLPVLGICRGIQVMAVAAGGSLYQDLPTQRSSDMRHEVREFGRNHLAHGVVVDPSSKLHAALHCDRALVNSFHHQGVRDVPEGFVVTARAEDGLTEAMESPRRTFALGIQCHPEEMWQASAPEFAGLFAAFVEAARERSFALTA